MMKRPRLEVAAQALEALLMPGIGLIIGNALDGRWGSSPWGALVGAILGLAVSAKILLQIANREDKRSGNQNDNEN